MRLSLFWTPLWVLLGQVVVAPLAIAQVPDATGILPTSQVGDLVYYQMPCNFSDMAVEPAINLGQGFGTFGPFNKPSLVEDALASQLPEAERTFVVNLKLIPGVTPSLSSAAFLSVAGYPGFFTVNYDDRQYHWHYVDHGVRWCKFGDVTDARVKTLSQDDDGKCTALWTDMRKNPKPNEVQMCPRQQVPNTPNHTKGAYQGLSNQGMVTPYDVWAYNTVCYAACPDIATNISDLKRRLDDLNSGIQARLDALDKKLAAVSVPTSNRVPSKKVPPVPPVSPMQTTK